jgi:hypothetical protein
MRVISLIVMNIVVAAVAAVPHGTLRKRAFNWRGLQSLGSTISRSLKRKPPAFGSPGRTAPDALKPLVPVVRREGFQNGAKQVGKKGADMALNKFLAIGVTGGAAAVAVDETKEYKDEKKIQAAAESNAASNNRRLASQPEDDFNVEKSDEDPNFDIPNRQSNRFASTDDDAYDAYDDYPDFRYRGSEDNNMRYRRYPYYARRELQSDIDSIENV